MVPLNNGFMTQLCQQLCELGISFELAVLMDCYGIQLTRINIQSTLVISKSKGPAETLRDIRTSTYQMCKIDENTKRTTKFHK